MVLDKLLGSSGDSSPQISDHDSPIPDSILDPVQEEHDDALLTKQQNLRELADAVQRYIWSMEYTNKPGNAFFEQLAYNFQSGSLRLPLRVEGNVLFANILAEGWADIAANTSIGNQTELTTDQVIALREAHKKYAEHHGLEEHAHLTNVCAIKFRNEQRLTDMIDLAGLDDEQVNRHHDTADE